MTDLNQERIKAPDNKFEILKQKVMRDSVMEPGFVDGLMDYNQPMGYANMPNTLGNRLRTMFVDPVRNYVTAGAKGVSGEPLNMADIQALVEGNMDWGVGASLGTGLMNKGNKNILNSIPAWHGSPKKIKQAMKAAQKAAAKPIKEGGLGLRKNNTAKERADILFPVDVYHGTTSDFPSFDLSQSGKASGSQAAELA
ncbi:MAG: hypothetical protein DRP02_12740, partial [Candidatus Gerdarchaeota archaeon]